MASCFGFSAAKARAARVSIIILSQRSCTTLKTVAPLKIAPTKTMKRVLKLKVIQYCTNFLTLPQILRPQREEFIIDEILSSLRTTLAEALATQTPELMQKPTSQALSASTSFMPSPVTETGRPKYFKPQAIILLSSGVARAITLSFPLTTTFSNLTMSISNLPSSASVSRTLSRNVSAVMHSFSMLC